MRANRWSKQGRPPLVEIVSKTHLKTGARRVALLLLGTLGSTRLAAGALSTRRLALSARHCWSGRVKKIGNKMWEKTVDGRMRIRTRFPIGRVVVGCC